MNCLEFAVASASPFRLRRRIGLHPREVDSTVEAEGATPFCRA